MRIVQARLPGEARRGVAVLQAEVDRFREFLQVRAKARKEGRKLNAVERERWQPYMYGRWMWTNAGWAWVSDEPFGWAPTNWIGIAGLRRALRGDRPQSLLFEDPHQVGQALVIRARD